MCSWNPEEYMYSTCSFMWESYFEQKHKFLEEEDGLSYPFPELVSSGRLEVHTLTNPTIDGFRKVLESVEPNVVYLQGEKLQNGEIGSLVWNGVELSTAVNVSGIFGSPIPDTVYLEVPNGEKLAKALSHKGVPYVIHWKYAFSCYEACHFLHTLLAVLQSSCSHAWDAFQLAQASFTLYCVQNYNFFPTSSQNNNWKLGPQLLREPPKISIYPLEKPVDNEEEDEELFGGGPTIKIYDNDVNMKILVCGTPFTLDVCLLGSLENGLTALLNTECSTTSSSSRGIISRCCHHAL